MSRVGRRWFNGQLRNGFSFYKVLFWYNTDMYVKMGLNHRNNSMSSCWAWITVVTMWPWNREYILCYCSYTINSKATKRGHSVLQPFSIGRYRLFHQLILLKLNKRFGLYLCMEPGLWPSHSIFHSAVLNKPNSPLKADRQLKWHTVKNISRAAAVLCCTYANEAEQFWDLGSSAGKPINFSGQF